MNRYIIDEEQIDRFCGCISSIEAEKIIDEIRSVPYNPQAERDKVLDKLVRDFKDYFDSEHPIPIDSKVGLRAWIAELRSSKARRSRDD